MTVLSHCGRCGRDDADTVIHGRCLTCLGEIVAEHASLVDRLGLTADSQMVLPPCRVWLVNARTREVYWHDAEMWGPRQDGYGPVLYGRDQYEETIHYTVAECYSTPKAAERSAQGRP
ncbi:MAG TPA: hypothetical protein VMZ50_08950, partial [Phycisphaerae bacterium]|nr:hypothetical protein [Phycisphaerae bacterium]